MGLDLAKRNLFNRRVYVISIFKGLFLVFIAARLGFLQIFSYKKHKLTSRLNSTKISFSPAPRGDVLDRKGKKIATTKQSKMIIYTNIPLKQSGIPTINAVLDIIYKQNHDAKAIAMRKILKYAKNNPHAEIPLYTNLSDDLLERVSFHLPSFKNIEIQTTNIREYLLDNSAAHVVGYVQKASQDMVNNASNIITKKLYRSPNYFIGAAGIESAENEWLAGRCGVDGMSVDNVGNGVGKYSIQQSIAGNEIQVTLDADIQNILAKNLEGKSGAGVVLDIETGDIIAMQSAPSFNPNAFLQWDNSVADFFLNPEKPLLNRCIAGLYPPGSTFKPITAITAVANGWDPEKQIFCNGKYTYGNRTYHCWKKEGHGKVDLHKALAQSCNVYLYSIGAVTDIDKIHHMAHTCGFDQTYDIGIGREHKGCIPSRQWKREKMKEVWVGGDTINTVIGQGFNQVNILQLAVVAARIASGKNIHPSIWKEFIRKNQIDNLFHAHKQQISDFKDLDIPPEALEIARKGLYSCMNDEFGALFHVSAPYREFQICGKTGTAQVVSRRIDADVMRGNMKFASNGLFFGYAPFDKPKYAIAVVVEKGIWGSISAAPVAMNTLAFALKK